MITIEAINEQTIEAMILLLFERNKTLPEYVRWKYGQNYRINRGAIALVNGEPAGCFGLIPREINLPDKKIVMCGWFADWYVSPRFRDLKVGTNLLNEISNVYPVTLGHPGPIKAQFICKQNGYREIGFQSRRRLILKPWKYAQFRTYNPLKAVVLGFQNAEYLKANIFNTNIDNYKDEINSSPEEYASFSEIGPHQEWIFSQPVSQTIATRKWKQWEDDDLRISYVEDNLTTGEKRCLVLYATGLSIYSPQIWKKFFIYISQIGATYIDMFTTFPRQDEVWHTIGAKPILESPVLVRNFQNQLFFYLFGWDRENWTFLANLRE